MEYGVSNWGNEWLNALNGVDLTNRLPRGKSYANTGKVYDIKIDDNKVTSKVKGRYSDYYDTRITFDTFNDKEKEIILETIKQSPSLLSALLNHQLPLDLHEILLEKGVNPFPTSVDDIRCHCSCPDYAYICKHVAGLLYMVTHEVDKNPFLVFKLQDCDLLDLLDYDSTSDNIKSIDDLFTYTDNQTSLLNDDIDFSLIPDLSNNILALLKQKPLFYEKDFKDIFENLIKAKSRYAKREIDNYHRNFYGFNIFNIIEDPSDKRPKYEEDYPEWFERQFIEKWDKPNQWEVFNMEINDDYNIDSIYTACHSPFDENPTLEYLLSFFVELSESPIDKYNKEIQFYNLLYQFTVELIKKHALTPELFVSNGQYHIRWIPAIFDKTIKEIIDKLVQLCPYDLLYYNDKSLSKTDQILAIVSLFAAAFDEYFLRWGITKKLEKNCQYNAFNLFLGKPQYFDKFSEQGYEKLINQWLSSFVLSYRDYDLYLVIEEEFDRYTVEVKVSVDGGEMININEFIGQSKNTNLKLQLISDTYIINELFPQVNQSIDLNENMELDIDEFSEFFLNTLPLFEVIGITIILPKNLQKIFRPKLKLDIAGSKNEKGYLRFTDIVKFDWKIHIGDNIYDINEFKKMAEKSRGLVKLNNQYVILDEDETKKLIKDIEKLPEKLNKHELTKALLSGEYKDAEVEIDENLTRMLDNIGKYEKYEIPDSITANLRNYQKNGYSWLVQNINTGFGSILADDMGLGKTLQTLTAIQHFKDEGYLDKEKVLVVAPTSLLTNWQEEIRKFTPDLTSYIFHGTKRKFPKQEYDIYLTSYGVIRKDVEKFNKRKWFITIIDEAQNIKNPDTQQTRAVKKIKAKHKIALSGTPVENRLSEYWSIFDFINKGYLSTLKQFRQNYILPIEKEKNHDTLENFKQITQPFILRRLKSDKNIIKDLPDKITNDIYCDLSKQQVSLYKEILDSSMDEVDANEGIKRKGLVLKLITSLKQVCNHPSQYSKSKRYNVDDSGKMQALMSILENILESNEKVLIFTQYVQMGSIMKNLVEDKFNEEVLFLHGSLSRKKRDELVKRFQENTQSKIFIISLKAGGTGLNLTAASNVIHYDLWWNPAVENQATDRAYRIGQKDNVMVYRFITKGTFEEKINQMIHDKKELAQLTVGTGEQFITEMNDKQLRDMFKLRKT